MIYNFYRSFFFSLATAFDEKKNTSNKKGMDLKHQLFDTQKSHLVKRETGLTKMQK